MPIIGPILDLAGGIIDKIFPDKQKAAKAKMKLLELHQKGQLTELETRMSAILAEAQSEDPWTSRARPMFMYVFYLLLLFAIPMGILSVFNPEAAATISQGMTSYLSALPESLWWLFGTGYLGYTGVRSFEKKKLRDIYKGLK